MAQGLSNSEFSCKDNLVHVAPPVSFYRYMSPGVFLSVKEGMAQLFRLQIYDSG